MDGCRLVKRNGSGEWNDRTTPHLTFDLLIKFYYLFGVLNNSNKYFEMSNANPSDLELFMRTPRSDDFVLLVRLYLISDFT